MTENDFQIIYDLALNSLENKSEYVQLCEDSWDYDNCKGLKKSEALAIKNELKFDYKLADAEKMFYKDYYFGNIHLRFMIPYGHGMIDCSYRIFSPIKDNSIPSFSFRRIVQSVTGDFENYEKTFPMNTSVEEYKENLKFILKLNKSISRIFDKEFSKLNDIED